MIAALGEMVREIAGIVITEEMIKEGQSRLLDLACSYDAERGAGFDESDVIEFYLALRKLEQIRTACTPHTVEKWLVEEGVARWRQEGASSL